MTKMIKDGNSYADNTDQVKMSKERFDGIESECRSNSVEKNLEIWEKM